MYEYFMYLKYESLTFCEILSKCRTPFRIGKNKVCLELLGIVHNVHLSLDKVENYLTLTRLKGGSLGLRHIQTAITLI